MGIRIATLICLAAWFASGRPVQAEPAVDSTRDLVFPIYSSSQQRPVAIVRAALSRRDHLQKGFFKIGLFPIVVVEELDIEIRQPGLFQETLTRTAKLLTGRKRIRGLEVHGFRLRSTAKTGPAFDITAKRARHMNGNAWLLAQTTVNGTRHSEVLLLTGPDGPMLRLRDGSSIDLINHPEFQSQSRTEKKEP